VMMLGFVGCLFGLVLAFVSYSVLHIKCDDDDDDDDDDVGMR